MSDFHGVDMFIPSSMGLRHVAWRTSMEAHCTESMAVGTRLATIALHYAIAGLSSMTLNALPLGPRSTRSSEKLFPLARIVDKIRNYTVYEENQDRLSFAALVAGCCQLFYRRLGRYRRPLGAPVY